QRDGKIVKPLEVVGRIELGVPLETQPLDVFPDRVDVLDVFFGRVRVVKAEVADTAPLLGDAEVQADGLRVSDVKIAVWFRRKPRRRASMVLPGREILVHDGADEVEGRGRGGRSMVVAHSLASYCMSLAMALLSIGRRSSCPLLQAPRRPRLSRP